MIKRNAGKVALLNSPYFLTDPMFQRMPPLSILYLASYYESRGHEVKIFSLDCEERFKGTFYFGYDVNNLIEGLKEFRPDMIGVSCPYSARWLFVKRLLAILKPKFRDVPLVIGGIHPTAFHEHCLEDSRADYIIIGEGEGSSTKLLESFLRGERYPVIDGLAYKKADKIVFYPKKEYIKDLDALPYPAYHLLDIKEYKSRTKSERLTHLKGLYFSLLTSRSCPNQCTYCNMFLAHGKKWRYRSAGNVLDEIDFLVKKYQVRQFAIVDDNFTTSKPRAKKILQGIIARDYGIKFLTPNGLSIKALDDELVMLLKKAGALEISIAIESGSEKIRNEVYNKRISNNQVFDIVKSCRKHKLPVRTFFMVGAPGETDETVQETIEMIKKLKTPSAVSITTPYKGTELYNYYIKMGVVKEEDLQQGTTIDLRMPIEKAGNYEQINSWRRKISSISLLYAWPRIIFDRGYMNLNTISRGLRIAFFPKRIGKDFFREILDNFMPIQGV